MRAVNLLPGAQRTRGRRSPALGGLANGRAVPAALAVASLALLGGLVHAGNSAGNEAERLEGNIAAAQAQRIVLSAELEDFREESRQQELQAARRGAITAMVGGRIDWERIVRDVAIVVPEDVWLTNVATGSAAPAAEADAADDPAAPAAGPAPTITIQAVGDGQPSAAAMMARVGVVPGISRPRLVSSAFEQVEGARMVRFVIEAGIDQRAQDRAELAPVSLDPAGGNP